MGIPGLGSINPVNIALLATPGGPAALLVRNLASSIGQNLIQQFGQAIGLPQSAIDMAQGRFSLSQGDFRGAVQNFNQATRELAQEYRASQTEEADAQRNLQDTIRDIVSQQSESEEMKAARGGGKGGQSWLMAIAEVLGDKLNDMAHELTGLAQEAADDPSKATIFGAKSQEFGILMNSANTGLKAIGEGLTQMARKGG